MIKPLESVKNIGGWLDKVLAMEKQINSMCKSASYHLRNIAKRTRKFIYFKYYGILIHAFIYSKLEHCNLLYQALTRVR